MKFNFAMWVLTCRNDFNCVLWYWQGRTRLLLRSGTLTCI